MRINEDHWRACGIDPHFDAHPYHQLISKGFKDLGDSNGWFGNRDHPSQKIYADHDDWQEIYATQKGYHITVSPKAKAFYETDSSD